ncbi:RnfABCDGE type electron transport complex subunit D [Ruminococcus sp.]|uniref:RnfABCDGE type electron transport complex subunit D n=1 Tax=Ruminococcus sp. TaxID=41978 RepID=UPI001B4B4822|nr:RnfABCDGE type electron transport complex subunit D [Ruminococcus sp.]MBP5432834.1 RnfABCDGE type electron transport complex subunit D [Ruminococcus sp.]
MLKKARKERLIWLDIMITLLTLELMSYFYYGIRSVVLAGICVAAAAAAELISVRLMKRSFSADDLTCTSDGLILALMFPAVMDYKIAFIAVIFSIVVAKNIFGGRLNMIFSPAAVGYVFVLTSWGRKLLQFTEPHIKTGIFDVPETLVNSASHTFNLTGVFKHSDFEILLGNFSGPSGAVSILLLVVAAVVLIFRRSISAGAFIGTIFGTGFFAVVTPAVSSRADSLKYSLVTNMVLFAAIYIVSDVRIAPKRDYYAFFYGLFIGVISYVLVLTGAKENAIVMVAVLFTPIALGFRNLENRIEIAAREHEVENEGYNVRTGEEGDIYE